MKTIYVLQTPDIILITNEHKKISRGRSVSKIVGDGLAKRVLIPGRSKTFLFTIHPPIQRILGAIYSGVK
jgi:hypothetical protein